MTGAEFKSLRISKGFKTRPQLAKALGNTPDSIRKWETGKRKVSQIAINFLRSMK